MNKRKRWTPYLLLMPSLIYLALFFALPMVSALRLAFWADNSVLNLRADNSLDSPTTGQVRQTLFVTILDSEGVPIAEDAPASAGFELWYQIRGVDAEGETLEGWVFDRRVRVDDPAEAGAMPTSGIIRAPRRSDADPNTELWPLPGAELNPVGSLPANAAVEIIDQATVQLWYLVSSEQQDGSTVEGWAQGIYLEPNSELTSARVARGDDGEWTLRFIERMINDRLFDDAVITTLLLMVIIIPIQFVLAIIMALILQSQLRGNTIFLYFFAIPLGVSDLAVGIVWSMIFAQSGYLNSFLVGTGLVQNPIIFISVETRHWIIAAVVLAEVWRATSIVMVIVVSGLQAVPTSYLEAAEIFGATLWQRLRYVILPLLKPSLQVALILRTILAFQVFAVVVAIAGRSMTTLANETFQWYDELRNPNVSAAYAGFILLLSMISAIFYLRAVRTQEELAT